MLSIAETAFHIAQLQVWFDKFRFMRKTESSAIDSEIKTF